MSSLVEMIKRHEGVKSKVYLCSAGYETIGVGRNISESGLGLSDDEMVQWHQRSASRCNDRYVLQPWSDQIAWVCKGS